MDKKQYNLRPNNKIPARLADHIISEDVPRRSTNQNVDEDIHSDNKLSQNANLETTIASDESSSDFSESAFNLFNDCHPLDELTRKNVIITVSRDNEQNTSNSPTLDNTHLPTNLMSKTTTDVIAITNHQSDSDSATTRATTNTPPSAAVILPTTNPNIATTNLLGSTELNFLTQINYMFESLKTEITGLKTEIKFDNEMLKTEIKSDINLAVKSLRDEINECRDIFNHKVEDLTKSHSELHNEINQIKDYQSAQNNEIRNLESRISEQTNNIREDLITDLEKQNAIFQKSLVESNQNLTTTIDNKIQDTKQDVISQITNIKVTNDIQLQKLESKVHQNMQTHIQENNKIIEKLDDQIHIIQNKTDTCENQLEQLRDKINTLPNNIPSTIKVVCSGSTMLTPDLTQPKFHGRSHNPSEFLSKLKKYYERNLTKNDISNPTTEHLHDIIESCLEQHAARWFYLIKGDVKTWSDFEEAFLARYFSRDVQRGLRQRMEVERYRPNGALTRAEYFVERVILLNSLTPPMSEDEIVSLLSEHFSEIIQDARRVQNVNTVQEFEALLQREDIKDNHRRSKNQHHSNTNNLRNNSNKQTQNSHDEVNHNAYRPRFERNNHQSQPHNNQYRSNQNYSSQHRPYQNGYNPHQNRGNHNYHNNYRGQNNNQSGNSNSNGHQNQHNNHYNSDRRYPTPEQSQVCTTIVENRSSPQQSSSPTTRDDASFL